MSWAVEGLRFGANSCSAASTGPRIAALLLRGLLFGSVVSVSSDAEEMVPTGGELTLFEAVGRWA
jgi:hypothetical protein